MPEALTALQTSVASRGLMQREHTTIRAGLSIRPLMRGALFLAPLYLLAACSNSPSREELEERVSELEEENSHLREQLADAQTKADDAVTSASSAKEAASDAQDQMDRFKSEDWSNVVGDAQGAADQAADTADQANQAAQDAQDALQDQ